jgi:amidohydrolase
MWLALAALLAATALPAQPRGADAASREVEALVTQVMPKVVAWRRDVHQHPELGNREFRTAKLVAEHLQKLGLEVRTGIAKTGVVGILKGGQPGPVVALRADMDALPVTEMADLPFKSTVRTTYNGMDVGVMHACGHDNHVAILMGAAEVLSGMRARVPGTIVFVFQPAEEGPPAGEEGGAPLMMKEGALDDPKPSAIFGLHVWPGPVGTIEYRPEGAMAAPDGLQIIVRGRQTHGAVPWGGVDPIVVAAQIVLGLQTISSRQIDVTRYPAIVTIGMIQGGNRGNIIPDSVVMVGTIRTFDDAMRKDIHDRIRRTTEGIAAAAGATATVTIPGGGLLTYNDPALTERMIPTLRRVVGADNLKLSALITGSEDFPAFTRDIPGFYFFLGVNPKDQDPVTAPRNHSPYFFADESALPIGVRAMVNVALDYLRRPAA